jgi:polysaccharide export outer membrane protein
MTIRTIWQLFLVFFFSFNTVSALAQTQIQPPDYRLGPGDNIKIQVFQNPDLTLETRVTEQGTITFPLIGTVKVGDMPVAAAEQTISTALRDGGFIKQPHVNIILIAMRGNNVSVLGQVNKPGRFPLETVNVRASEMLAVAGGIAPTGADIAIVTGIRDGKAFRQEIDVANMFLNNQTQSDPVMAPGDVIYVHRVPMFYIYGEVQKPGAYRIERGMTVRQALAQGGGPTVRGTERRLGLYRRGEGQKVEARTDLGERVQPEDVFFVRESLF